MLNISFFLYNWDRGDVNSAGNWDRLDLSGITSSERPDAINPSNFYLKELY